MTKMKPFPFPPLQEVAFEISYKPKMKVLSELAEFQDKISADYPKIGEEIPSPMTLSEREGFSSKFLQRIRFENEPQTRIIRITIGSFNYIDRAYTSFVDFSKEVVFRWNQFDEGIGGFDIGRVGLRYINMLELPINHGNISISKYTKPYFISERFDLSATKRIRLEARTRVHGMDLNIRSGIVDKSVIEGREFCLYELDYDCSVREEAISKNIGEIIDSLHSAIEEQFLNDVEEDYKVFMRTGKWE